MNKLLTICTIIFFSLTVSAQNQFKELQRAILFDTLHTSNHNYIAAAQLSSEVENLRLAEMFINQAYLYAATQDERSKVLITKADIYIAAKKYFNAVAALMQADTAAEPSIQNEVNRRLGICYYCLGQYDKSTECFLKSLPEERHDEFLKLSKKWQKKSKPSPAVAGVASAIVPGLGQYMSLSVIDGVSSEVILGSLAMLGVYLAKNYGNWTAILCVLPWFQRYYLGGIKNASDCAKKHSRSKYRHYICFVNNMFNSENDN